MVGPQPGYRAYSLVLHQRWLGRVRPRHRRQLGLLGLGLQQVRYRLPEQAAIRIQRCRLMLVSDGGPGFIRTGPATCPGPIPAGNLPPVSVSEATDPQETGLSCSSLILTSGPSAPGTATCHLRISD